MLKNNTRVPLDKFIEKSLFDKSKGYYMVKNPIGYKGDFITSPNISVMFSEMIAIWIISFWKKIGSPKKINIVELGGGNGEMMFQIIKTIKKFEKFEQSAKFIILDKSPFLKNMQKIKMKNMNIVWTENIKKISKYPTIFLANEFFDVFPIKQFVKKKNLWFEKYIIYKDKTFKFCEKKIMKQNVEKLLGEKIAKNQKFLEFSKSGLQMLDAVSKKIKKQNGGLLIIDYGYKEKKMFDSIQSIKNHKKANFLENPYNCDITHLINFHLFKKKLKKNKLDFIKLTSQREFLINMGIKERAEIISKNLPFSSKVDVYLRIKRLIDKNQMGSLFKVLLATKKINNFSLGF